jgi:hypothetical protein
MLATVSDWTILKMLFALSSHLMMRGLHWLFFRRPAMNSHSLLPFPEKKYQDTKLGFLLGKAWLSAKNTLEKRN